MSSVDLLSSDDTHPPQQLNPLKVSGCAQLAAVSGFALAFAPPDPRPPPPAKAASPAAAVPEVSTEVSTEEGAAEGDPPADPPATSTLPTPGLAPPGAEEEAAAPKPPRGLGGVIYLFGGRHVHDGQPLEQLWRLDLNAPQAPRGGRPATAGEYSYAWQELACTFEARGRYREI